MMIDGALEIACTVLVATGFVLAITVFQSDQWQASDTGTVFTQATTKNGGIWQTCVNEANSGTSTCSTYDSFFLGLPLHIQVARACTITSLLLGIIATIFTMTSIPKCPCAPVNNQARDRMRMFGGLAGILGGCCLSIGVTWYAVTVMEEYYRASIVAPDSERQAFGQAIFIGWSGGAGSVIGGVMALCISQAHRKHPRDDSTKLYYQNPARVQEYV